MDQGNNRVILPNQVQMQVKNVDPPNAKAEPHVLVAQTPHGVTVHIIGGLTKLEWMAGMVAAGGDYPASEIVDLAEELLVECKRREQ